MGTRIEDAGRREARLVVVGDAPTKWDDMKEQPFVGPGGQRLTEWMQDAGLGRRDTYWTYVYPFKPVHALKALPKVEIEHWTDELHRRLSVLEDPIVLVPTDDLALQALTGKKGIQKWRGSILSYVDGRGRTIKVIPTLHPNETFKKPSLERRCRYDWIRIGQDLGFRELRLPQRELFIRPTIKDVLEYTHEVTTKASALSVDIETPRELKWKEVKTKTGKTSMKKVYGAARVTCVGFATNANFAICVPTTPDYWGHKGDVQTVWACVRKLCDSKAEKVLQNGLFDSFYLRGDHGITLRNYYWDTLALHHALDSTDQHSLAYMASTWTREPYWKDDAKDEDELENDQPATIEDFWTYNCKDAAVTYELADALSAAVEADGIMAMYRQHYPPLFEPLLSMMLRGVRRDPERAKALLDEFAQARASLRVALDAVTTGTVQRDGTPWGQSVYAKKAISQTKLKAYLYDVLRLPKRTKRDKTSGTSKVTSDEVTLRKLALKFPKAKAPVELILQDQRLSKVGSFLKDEAADADGYVRCMYKYTYTRRLSSSKNPRRTGQNLQNVDHEVRSVYRPDPGTLFLEADASQAEDRIVKVYAYNVTKNQDLLDRAYANSWENDEHKRAAAAIFGVPLDQVTKAQRSLGKTTRHAVNYDEGGGTMSEGLLKSNIIKTPDECQAMIERLHAADPEIREWQRSIRAAIMRDRALTNAWGWTWSCKYERMTDDLYKKGYAYKPQSNVGILTNQGGLIPVHAFIEEQRRRTRRPEWMLTRVALQVHDAVIVCVTPETVYEVARCLKQNMEREMVLDGTPLTIPVELKLGTSWKMEREWKPFPARDELEAAARALLEGGA